MGGNEMEKQKGWKDVDNELRRHDKILIEEYHYSLARWLQMWRSYGLEGATKQIVKMPDSHLLRFLWKNTRLDLSAVYPFFHRKYLVNKSRSSRTYEEELDA
jgi:hypothetical protein